MSLSGSFSNYPTSQFGLYCEWRGKQSAHSNSTEVTVDVYLRYYNIILGMQDGGITINGVSSSFISPEINNGDINTWTNTLIGSFTTSVPHNPDGTKIGVHLSVYWNFYGTYAGESIDVINASDVVDLDALTTYSLSIDPGENSNILVERISSGAVDVGVIDNGGILYYGDRLKISFSADNDYRVDTHTVNGSTFVSGGVIIVYEDISVSSTASVIVKQAFNAEDMQCNDASGRPLTFLYQWEKDVSITIKNVAMTPPPTFQFANRMIREAISVESVVSGEDLVVTIPNVLLEYSEAISAFIYLQTSSGMSRTLGSIYFPVRARRKPSDTIYYE